MYRTDQQNLRSLTFAKNNIENNVKERVLFKNYKERSLHLWLIDPGLAALRSHQFSAERAALAPNQTKDQMTELYMLSMRHLTFVRSSDHNGLGSLLLYLDQKSSN